MLSFRHYLLLLAVIAALGDRCHGFSTQPSTQSSTPSTTSTNNNVLILDHINMNHGKGRHDWLKAFYGDFLGCAWDPRKAKNLDSGSKTLWVNLGAHQFHLPEGSPDAQVLDGIITLLHPSPNTLLKRYDTLKADVLKETFFDATNNDEGMLVTDPWGTRFRILESENKDPRGSQPGDTSEGCAISDLTVHCPPKANLEGIGRFYKDILGARVLESSSHDLKIQMGPYQTLTFLCKEAIDVDTHVDLREVPKDEEEYVDMTGTSSDLGNYGVHISLYVADFVGSYQRARDSNLAYVNRRFGRRAYTLEEATKDCMFRCLDIVDPLNVQDGPILRLEHEVRSVVKPDGSKYKSCPFDEIPDACV